MADTEVQHINVPTQAAVPQKFVDLGDGTYAGAVSIEGAGGGVSSLTPGTIVDDADLDGSAAVLEIDDTGADCVGVWAVNHGGFYDLIVVDVASGAAAPTPTATTGHIYRIPPGTDRLLPIGPNRDVYAISASGDATVLTCSFAVMS